MIVLSAALVFVLVLPQVVVIVGHVSRTAPLRTRQGQVDTLHVRTVRPQAFVIRLFHDFVAFEVERFHVGEELLRADVVSEYHRQENGKCAATKSHFLAEYS